jgi:isochorismate synthase
MLFLSLPGSTHYRCYESAEEGAYTFSFVPFSGDEAVHVKMQPCELPTELVLHQKQTPPESADKESHINLVKRAVAEIKARQLGKIVVARAKFVAQPLQPLSLFEKLCAAYPQACVYLFTHPVSGTWLGATPELLLEKAGQQVRTMSLAGTREKGHEMSFAKKEQHEQELVTGYIAETLKNTPGLVQVAVQPTELSAAGNLVHYKNEISAGVEGVVNWDLLLHNFHPTPAVAGFPKREALAFLKREERLDRAYYAGYFGLQHEADFRYFVNLRCLQLFETGYALYAGGGITAASDAEAEWHETEVKMQTLGAIIEKQ